MNNTQECRVQASWIQVGKSIHRLPNFIYRVPCMSGRWVSEHLGAIKERSDGRWNWWRKKSKFHPTWIGDGQGVKSSQGAAEMRVLEGWNREDTLQVIHDSLQTLTGEQTQSLRADLSREMEPYCPPSMFNVTHTNSPVGRNDV